MNRNLDEGTPKCLTEAILDAEGGRYDRDPLRIWVFANEITDGTWGGGGRIARLADIAAIALGDRDKGRAYAARRLAGRRAVHA